MKHLKSIFLLVGLPAILFCGCDFFEGYKVAYSDFVTLANNSDRDIVVRMSLNYPDTSGLRSMTGRWCIRRTIKSNTIYLSWILNHTK